MRDMTRDGVHVAVKIMKSDTVGSALVDEALKLREFDHPNIVKCFDAQLWMAKNLSFIVLEYCDQGSLEKYMERTPLGKLRQVRSQLARSVRCV